MNLLSIDIGSYSIKFITTTVVKKKLRLQHIQEVVVSQYIEQTESNLEYDEAVVNILSETLDFEGFKTISQFPNVLLSSRIITIPIKNKRKAELTLPFMLEEEIPFSINQVHLASLLQVDKEVTNAYVSFTPKDNFENYFELYSNWGLLTDVLTNEASCFANYVDKLKITEPISIIDIGHRTTKVYMFNKGKLVGSNISYIAGHTITSAISNNYNIEYDEALIYKHQNSFLLTPDQYDEVNAEQKEFATLMDKVFKPLIDDFKMWAVNQKIQSGEPIQKIYLTGGSSNLRNISNYFKDKLHINVGFLNTFDTFDTSAVQIDNGIINRFNFVNCLTLGLIEKNKIINFRTGPYTNKSSEAIPFHSGAFYALRVAIVCLILFGILGIERYFLQKDIKFVNQKIFQVIKSPQLGIKTQLQKQFKRRPDSARTKRVYNTVAKKHRLLKSQIDAIEKASTINAFSPLLKLSQLLNLDKSTYVTLFESNQNNIKFAISSENPEELKSVKSKLQDMGLNGLKAIIKDSSIFGEYKDED